MKNLNQQFTTFHIPVKALLFYHAKEIDNSYYVESYDVNEGGRLTDPHPLGLLESQRLAQSLLATDRLSDHFLRPKGLLPEQVLYIQNDQNGYAIWYTPPMRRNMVFIQNLGLKDGSYALPAMVWKASRDGLQVFALKQNHKPTLTSLLYHAPFFNIHDDGRVCMGTVDIEIDRYTFLEDFIRQWEEYFFQSKFSHVLGGCAPLKGNIIQVWQSLFENKKKFRENCLRKHHLTLTNLIQ